MHNLRQEITNLSNEQITAIIAKGSDEGRMPGFRKKLGPETVSALTNYLLTLLEHFNAGDHRTVEQRESSAPIDENATRGAVADPSTQNHQQKHEQQLPPAAAQQSQDQHATVPGVIDLNSASKETLMTLPGLTEQDALNIIRGRPYRSTLQFKVRRIIAPELYDRIAQEVIAKQARK